MQSDNSKALSPKPNLAGLVGCTEEARVAALDNDPGPADPKDFHQLLGRLQAAKPHLPKLYQLATAQPFFDKLEALGESSFHKILLQDPDKQGEAGLMLDIAQAILQDGEHFDETQTDAFEEVVADLYDGFLSAQDRAGIKMPDKAVLPPMVKWGNPGDGPYTWPIDATRSFDLEAAVVNMPPSNARKGLVAWAALGHETCGHDILHADIGLQPEMGENVRKALKGLPADLANYWADRIDETSSDVMGILNTGAAAAIGLVAYFRGLSSAFGGDGKLRSNGPANDPHPADILRGYLGAETVRLLSFDRAKAWADAIENETDKDLGDKRVRVAARSIKAADAKNSARVVAETLVKKPTKTLHDHALIDIQDWRDSDETIVAQIRPLLSRNLPLASNLAQGIYAAHAVSAAVIGALARDSDIPILFSRMVQILKLMHDKSPTWGPLAVIHRGNISRDFAYNPARQYRAAESGFLATNSYEPNRMPDEATILKVVCQQLQLLANFNPPLTDNAGNPAPNVSDRNVKDVYVRIDKEDGKADPSPPKPRLATFVDNLKAELGDFDLEPQQLVAGRYPTIGHLVRHIQTA